MDAGHGEMRRAGRRWRIVLLTCRDPSTDFRLPLAEELQALGHDVAMVYLKRRPMMTEMSDPSTARTFELPAFLRQARGLFQTGAPLLVFNTTNLVFPGVSRALRLLVGGLWCFDMHDDLLYDRTGLRRRRMKIAQRVLLGGSDLIVRAAPTLGELFPRSHHLGNASTITPIVRPAPDFGRVLILASLDKRLDFGFLLRTAELNPHLGFDIFGQVSEGDPGVTAQLDLVRRERANIVYRGPYVNRDLPSILGAYSVTLAPYAVGSPLTYYLDPLRFYHCLNSGMEVLSTDIPGARSLEARLHIVTTPEEVGPLVERLRDAPSDRRNADPARNAITWQSRAVRLMEIVEETAP